MIKRVLVILFGLFGGVIATTCSGQSQPPPAETPTVKGVLDSSRTAVFESPQQSCNSDDIPDAMARAFRDSMGTLHLVAASSELFQNLGPTLETVQHSCEVGHYSANDPNPADFNDQSWIDDFYTFDGIKIAALTHMEYHGWAHPGECTFKNGYNGCEYDSDTYHESEDGGYHFKSFNAPNNFLAGVPYKYVKDKGPSGYSVDSNIIELGGWYYAMVTSWQWPADCSGQTGPNRCITSGAAPMRTQNVFDPSSWRGWSGTDFSVSFVDPYPGPVERPLEHVYTPVPYMDVVTGINLFESSGVVIAVLWNPWTNEYGAKGFYLSTSTDLANWTKPKLVATLDQFLAQEPPGNWSYAYFSLIDPAAPDLNFSIVGSHPYLYYVRFNSDGSSRVLFRQGITLTLK
ncbi:MAG TPA: hypothetical protein VK828_20235 [Terriglobales bacterium]|nr:hypothetical protein [Terriglobales bacterium]